MELPQVDLPFWRLTTLQHPSRHPEPQPGGGICHLFSSPTSWLCLAQDTPPHHISCCYLMSWPSPWKQTDLIPHLGSHACILSGPWLGKGRMLVWGALSTLLPGGDTPAAKAPSTPRLLGAGPTVTDTSPLPCSHLTSWHEAARHSSVHKAPSPASQARSTQPVPTASTLQPQEPSRAVHRARSALPWARSQSPSPGFGGWS